MSERGNIVGFPGPPPPSQGAPAPAGGAAGPASSRPLMAAGAGPGAPPPGMVLNPDFVQWLQASQAWHAEKARRERLFREACLVIRHDVARGYKIDIEADSTVAADEEAEKQARTEFLQGIIPLLQLLIPQAQQNPGAVPLVHALVMFGVRAFPAARGLEQTFEEAFRTLVQSPPPEPPPKGNVKPPMEIMSEHQIAMGEQAIDREQNQVEAQKNAIEAQKVQLQQQKNAIDMFEAQAKAAGAAAAQRQDAALKAAELAQRGREIDSRQTLDRARLTHLLARDTGGLV